MVSSVDAESHADNDLGMIMYGLLDRGYSRIVASVCCFVHYCWVARSWSVDSGLVPKVLDSCVACWASGGPLGPVTHQARWVELPACPSPTTHNAIHAQTTPVSHCDRVTIVRLMSLENKARLRDRSERDEKKKNRRGTKEETKTHTKNSESLKYGNCGEGIFFRTEESVTKRMLKTIDAARKKKLHEKTLRKFCSKVHEKIKNWFFFFKLQNWIQNYSNKSWHGWKIL